MTRLRPIPLLLLLVPATARANGLGALAAFVFFLVLLAGISGAVCLGLTIASALIARPPLRPWKRKYAIIAIVLTSLCGLILLPLSVLAIVLLFEVPRFPDMILFLGVLLCGALGVASLWLSIRVLRRNPKT
jgi:hypothetical protein